MPTDKTQLKDIKGLCDKSPQPRTKAGFQGASTINVEKRIMD